MFLSGAKIQNFIAMAILVSVATLCWSAEAADVVTQREKDSFGERCYAFNKSDYNVCVVYDVYPVWIWSSPTPHPTRGTVASSIPGHSRRQIGWAYVNRPPSLQCKLISQKYKPTSAPCP
jgi:hypothetical protein